MNYFTRKYYEWKARRAQKSGPTILDAVYHCMEANTAATTTYCSLYNPITKQKVHLKVDIHLSRVNMPPVEQEGNVIQFPNQKDTLH
jgi:hypothetical protein